MSSELKQSIEKILKGKFVIKSIENVNHKPHPFMIGPKHIGFCADNYYGMLGDSCIKDERFPVCSNPNCNLTYNEHTFDKVLFLSLTQNIANSAATKILKGLRNILTQEKIDGISFVDTPEKFRIK